MVTYSIFGVSIAESWFAPESDLPQVDLYYIQQALHLPEKYSYATKFHTLVINLEQEEEGILAGMNKKTRYKIRRADSQDSTSYAVDEQCDLKKFCEFFALCESRRKVATINMTRLLQYKQQGMLCISYTYHPDTKQKLTAHCYLVFPEVVRPVYACILRPKNAQNIEESNLIGRANCLHFWRDMQHFKKSGQQRFDCAGWYQGTNKRLASIARFKQGFGGEHQVHYTCVQVRSWKGRLYMLAKIVYLACRGKSL